MAISISIVDDAEETRASLIRLLGSTPGLTCLRAYATAETALDGIPEERPEVVLMDIRLPHMSGIECVAKLKMRLPSLKVLMLTTYEERDLIFNSLRAGASGYILKNATRAELVQAVEQVHSGGAPMSMPIARKLVSYFQRAPQPKSEVNTLPQREHAII